jgi:7-cyano-7-deazaguanine synthase
MKTNDHALVLFSGGQDSTTCLAWALERFAHVETIGFAYRQRHHVEMDCRLTVLEQIRTQFPHWSARLGDDHILDLRTLGDISQTALTQDMEIHMSDQGLPNTFVPGRNLIFLNFAGAIAYRRGLRHLIAGVCETDYSGYPDCRDDTLKAVQLALNLGMETRFVVHTPLMWIDKAASWQLAQQLGGTPLIELIQEHTHTCYRGVRDKRHDWGYGCGGCPACRLRAEGYENYRGGKTE